MPKYDRANLVVLQYASNQCYVQVADLLEAKVNVSVDEEAGTWSRGWFDRHSLSTRQYEIGHARFLTWDNKGGVVGVYDKTNTQHLNNMVHDACNATRERGSVVDED